MSPKLVKPTFNYMKNNVREWLTLSYYAIRAEVEISWI